MFVLLPVALLFCLAAVLVFTWAARSGQFDDLTTPGVRVLHDDESGSEGVADDSSRVPGPSTER